YIANHVGSVPPHVKHVRYTFAQPPFYTPDAARSMQSDRRATVASGHYRSIRGDRRDAVERPIVRSSHLRGRVVARVASVRGMAHVFELEAGKAAPHLSQAWIG